MTRQNDNFITKIRKMFYLNAVDVGMEIPPARTDEERMEREKRAAEVRKNSKLHIFADTVHKILD